MKKTKAITLAAIATLAIVVGGTYAWFVASANSVPVEISTGRIGIATGAYVPNNSTNKLPGEFVRLNNTTTPINNTGTRALIAKVDLSSDTRAWLNKTLPDNLATDIEDDYVLNTTDHRYYFTPERLAQVANISMEEGTNWIKIGNSYYALIRANSSIDLYAVIFRITGELGGGVNSGGTTTPFRQFEQGTQFSVGYRAVGVQTTEDAIKDVYGQTVLDGIKNSRPYWVNAN